MEANKKNYIELSCYEEKYDNGIKYENDKDNSWIITYINDEKLYICKNKYDKRIIKMVDIENFIRIWNYDMYNITSSCYNKNAEISIYILNKYYSGYKCNRTSKISIEIIQKYIWLLKDIIEEKEKDNKIIKNTEKNIEEDYNII